MKNFNIEINETLSLIGDKVVATAILRRITSNVITFTENSTIQLDTNLVRKYRFSYDNKQYSTWKEYNVEQNLELPIKQGKDLYVQVKYLLNSGEAELNSLTINYEGDDAQLFCPLDVEVFCHDGEPVDDFINLEECADNFIDTYDQQKIRYIYNNVNKVMTGFHGHKVKYFKVKESAESKDPIFKEYALHNVIGSAEFKVVIPDNEIPLNQDMNFNAWDMGYRDLFEIHIIVDEFCNAFHFLKQDYGVDRPEERDYLFLPVINKMFEVENVESIDQRASEGVFWKVHLKTHSTHGDLSHENELTQEEEESITFTADDQFAEEMDEGTEVSSPSQSFTGHEAFDPERKIINDKLTIANEEINNNFTIISYTNYLMDSIPESEIGIRYRNPLSIPQNGNFHFSSWFKINKIDQTNSLLNSKNDLVKIDLNQGTAINIILNGNQYTFNNFNQLDENKWYSYIIEGSQAGDWIRLGLYEIDDSTNTTKLKRIHFEDISLNGLFNNFENELIELRQGDYAVTNIRVLTKIINVEDHSNYLNKNVIEEDQNTVIVDQAMKSTDDRYFKDIG